MALTSCAKDDPIPQQRDPFSSVTPPFDLNGIDAEFLQDIPYDTFNETTFDIFLPESDTPTGLVIYYHGGGFSSGDKINYYPKANIVNFNDEFRSLLENGIAVATVNYRLIKQNKDGGVLKPLNDSKHALQYIRSNAKKLNISKNDIVLTGNSAGAGISLWIATYDEMSDPNNQDAVYHESTRVKAVALRETQSSYNLKDKWIDDIFSEFGITWEHFLINYSSLVKLLYGISDTSEYDSPSIIEYQEKIDMIAHLTSDDPELWVENVRQPSLIPIHHDALYHHPFFVRELIEKADLVNVKHVAYYGKDPIIYADPSGETCLEFLIRKVNE
jgi:para-nitrobenzyl esterase